MNKRIKIWLIVLGVIVVSGIVLYSGSAELFQGRVFKTSKPLPAYDENKCYDSDGGKNYEETGTIYGKLSRSDFGNKTDVCTTRTKVKEYYCDGKFIQSEEYNCENGCSKGACKDTSKISISFESVGESFSLNYSDYLSLDNGVEVHFGYYDFDGSGEKEFVIYSTKSVGTNDYLLLIKEVPLGFIDVGHYEIPLTCPKLKISISDADESDFVVSLNKMEELNAQYCIAGFNGGGKAFDFDVFKDGFFKYFLDKDMFAGQVVKNKYLDLLKLRVDESYSFSKSNLNIEPIYLDAISFVAKLNPSSSPFQGGFSYVLNNWGEVSEADVDLMEEEGNVNPTLTHELVHVFLYTTPVTKSWFEEGLAEYMGDWHSGYNNLQCFEDGWISGNSGLVAYSDFSQSPIPGADYNDPGSTGAYYKSAQCFWDYVEENYGKEAVVKVVQDWFDLTKQTSSPQMKWLINDVVNLSLGDDLTDLVQGRYNYVEGF